MRAMPSFLIRLLGLALCVATGACAADSAGWLARAVSGEVRRLEERHRELERELAALPASPGTPTSTRLGWHSKVLHAADEIVWVQVDLGKVQPVDAVALVPAHGSAQEAEGAGYGFPLRFRVEVARDEKQEERETVADFTAADIPNPRDLPLVVDAAGREARYVRVTVTRPWPRRDDWVVALGELIVLAGGRDIAAACPVAASSSLTSLPAWEAANLTDGQSLLGPPVSREPSPTNGYLAVQEPRADLTKWVQVDLGREVAVDAVRLFPARPQDFADSPGNGFPARFRVDVSDDESFTSATDLFDATGEHFVNPGDNPVTIPGGGARARFVRVTATQLYNRGDASSFALAEMQVWSGGANVASGARVTALDRFEDPRFPRWQPVFLVDGFNSSNRIIPDGEWLAGLNRRRELGRQMADLEAAQAGAKDAALAFLAKSGAAATGGILLAAGVLLWRAREAKRRAVEDLRRRIASDLHDEIGSQLGSIALAAQLAARHAHEPGAARERLGEIERIARETSGAMHDIVWLLKPGSANLEELVARLRETAAMQLRDRPHRFEVAGAVTPRALSIEFTRHVYLLFKEALANAVRHSGAGSIEIRITVGDVRLVLVVSDDGGGFDPASARGNGLDNMRRRAQELGASLRVDSAAGKGTEITLDAPMR